MIQFIKKAFFKLIDLLSLNRVWTLPPTSESADHTLKVALICIAKNEDPYIREWIDYHLLLGVDEIFIYQNNWRADPNLASSKVHLIEFDGECKQLPAYNTFIKENSKDFDFGIFIDIDEFVCLVNDPDIKTFLSRYTNFAAIGLNWRLFGDNGLRTVINNDYSLVKRFTRCGKKLNKHIKTIVNFRRMASGTIFTNPHHIASPGVRNCTVSVDKRFFIHGPFHTHTYPTIAWINHYRSKTIEEFTKIKMPRGRSDKFYSDADQFFTTKTFNESNLNDVESTIALDFLCHQSRRK